MATVLIALTGIKDEAQEKLERTATNVKGVLPSPRIRTLNPPANIIQGPGKINSLLGPVPVLCLEIAPHTSSTRIREILLQLTVALRPLLQAGLIGIVYQLPGESADTQAPVLPQAKAVPA